MHDQRHPARPELGGIPFLAPELASGHDGFAAGGHDALAAVEDDHFWFRCRRDLLVALLRRHAPGARSFCEVGCGNGSVLAALREDRPGLALCGVEASLAGLRHARRRLPGARLVQADAARLPFAGEFDAAGAFDVLEHLDDDAAALRALHRGLVPGGLLLVTVPQHRWLWSAADHAAGHRRRYTRCLLNRRLREAGFQIEAWTSYLVWLLPLLAASRLRRSGEAMGTRRLPRLLDRACEHVTRVETALTRRGRDHRFGGSLVAVARRVP